MERRLTTILAADLAGYSRLMAADEEGVIARLRAARAEVIDPAIAAGGGRIVKVMGDGLLVEFASPVAAVRAALRVQREMAAHETGPKDARLRLRVGINLGDVVVDGEDVLGDAVNVAARLETLAPVGGICIYRAVHDQARGRIDAGLVPLGPQAVKNIREPVEVWRVDVAGAEAPATTSAPRRGVAVLPFQTMSSDPELAFIADGIVEDVTTELGRFRWLFVIARSSASAYQDLEGDVRRIASDLGANYVVQGAVRGGGERLRLSARLIDAETGRKIWAEKWDRSMDDLFAVQDELTGLIVAGVEPEIGAHERDLARRKPTESMTAWDLCQRGYAEYATLSPQSMTRAEAFYRRAIELDSDFALPYAMLARQRYYAAASGLADDPAALISEGLGLAAKSLELDARGDAAHTAKALLLLAAGRPEDARQAAESGLSFNANNALLHYAKGSAEAHLGHADEALQALDMATRLSPMDPILWALRAVQCIALLLRDGEGDEARVVATANEATALANAGWQPRVLAAVIYARHGNMDKARRRLDEARAKQPRLNLELVQRGPGAAFAAARREPIHALVDIGLPE